MSCREKLDGHRVAKKHGQGSPVAENGDAIGDVAGHAIAARTESSEAAARCAAIPRNDDGSVGTIREHLDRIWFSAKAVIAPPRWPWPRSSAVTTALHFYASRLIAASQERLPIMFSRV